MPRFISEKSKQIIKDSAELITSKDKYITQKMYTILFTKYPHIKEFFSNAPKDQYMRLAEILSVYAVNIDKIDRLKPALLVIAKKHVEVHIQPSQYPMIGMVLMQAIEETLEDKATPELMDAWREAYQFLAEILIEMEKELYEKIEKK